MITYQCKLVLHSSYVASGTNCKQETQCKRRTVEPGTRYMPAIITGKHDVVYRSDDSVRGCQSEATVDVRMLLVVVRS